MATTTLPTKTEATTGQPSHNDDELLAMARMVRRGKGTFVLAFARCNSVPLREKLVARLKEAVEPFDVRPIEVTLTADDVAALPERLQAAASNGQPLFVYGLDQVMPSAHPEPALAQLNHRRAKFGHIDSPVVMWLPEYVLRLIAQHAPDFWSWRSGVYDFAPEAEISVPLYEHEMDEPYQVMTSLERDEKEKRLHLLMGLLDDYEGDNPTLTAVRSNVLIKIARLHESLGNYRIAEGCYQQSLEIYGRLGDQRSVAITQHGLANLYAARGDYDRADQLYRESLEAALNLGDRRGVAVTLVNLADLYTARGDYDRAEPLYRANLETLLNLGDRRGVAATQHGLADLYTARGDYDRAEPLYRESLKTFLTLGDRRGVAVAQGSLADLYMARGDYDRAEPLYRESLETKLTLGDRQGVAITQHSLADLYTARGDYDRAEPLYRASLETKLNLGNWREAAVTSHHWGMLERRRGNTTAAFELLTRSRQLFAEIGLNKDVAREDEMIAKLKADTATNDSSSS